MRQLKPDKVPEALIRQVLEAGICAANGGNMQFWRFVVIEDPSVKQKVGAYYRRAWHEQAAPRYRARCAGPGPRSRAISSGCSRRPSISRTISTRRRSGLCLA